MSSTLTFLTSTAFVDAIIVFLILETAVICAARAYSQSTNWFTPVARNAAGLFLLLALRFAIAAAEPAWILLALSAAFGAHLVDIRTLIPPTLSAATTRPRGTP